MARLIDADDMITFYPTYKELKHSPRFFLLLQRAFYPTYKELKPPNHHDERGYIGAFYPTYKELKLPFGNSICTPVSLFILPIRN